MDTLSTFVRRTHSPHGGAMPSESIGLGAAQELVGRVDERAMADLAAAARQYLPAVMAEIADLQTARVANPRALAQRAILFGIATPNRDEAQSLAWAIAANPRCSHATAQELAETIYPSPVTGKERGIGLYEDLAASITDMREHLPAPTLDDCVPERLETLRGIGPKVARMITAVAHPDARVWTVDLWHARQLLWAAGLEYRVKPAVSALGYPALEACWLRYRDAHFSDVPVWAAQWATWNAADGRHNEHRSLWADLAA